MDLSPPWPPGHPVHPVRGVWRTVGYEEVGVIWMISVHGLSF